MCCATSRRPDWPRWTWCWACWSVWRPRRGRAASPTSRASSASPRPAPIGTCAPWSSAATPARTPRPSATRSASSCWRWARRCATASTSLGAMRPEMAPLREATGQAVTASALVEGAVTVLEMLQGRTLIEFGVRPGAAARLPRLGPRPGRAGLRAAGADRRGAGAAADGLDRADPDRPAAVRAEVEAVRRQGWATAADAVLIGVNALAAPVFDHRGELARRHRHRRLHAVHRRRRRPTSRSPRSPARPPQPRAGSAGESADGMSYSLAVDIGGTFTDAVLRGADGALVVDKTLTTHHDLLEGFFRGVDLVLAKAGVSAGADRRRGGARHHRGHQRPDRAQGAADRADHHQGLRATCCRSATSIATRCTIRRSSSPSR